MQTCSYCGRSSEADAEHCGECGTPLVEKPAPAPLITRASAIGLSVFLLYLPHCWVFFINSHDSNRFLWQKMFPILPALFPMFVMSMFSQRYWHGRLPEQLFFAFAAGYVALMVWGIVFATGKWPRARLGIAAAVMVVSTLLAIAAYGLYAA